MDFTIPEVHRENWTKQKQIKIYTMRENSKKTMEHEGDGDTNSNRCTWNNPQRIDKGSGRHGNNQLSWDHPDYSFIKIGLKKSPGDLKKLTITQTPVKKKKKKKKKSQLTLV